MMPVAVIGGVFVIAGILMVGTLMFGYLQGWFTRTKNTREIQKPQYRSEITPEGIRIRTRVETPEEIADRAEAKRRAKEEFQAVKQLCETKNINLFDYLAAQDKKTFSRLARHVMPSDIKCYWPSKKPLPFWNSRPCVVGLVRGDSCAGFEEFDELYQLMGDGLWFESEARIAYATSAPIPRSFQLHEQFQLLCGKYLFDFLDKCELALEQVATRQEVKLIAEVIGEVLSPLVNRSFSSSHWTKEERRQKVSGAVVNSMTRVIENECNTTDDLELLSDLIAEAYHLHRWYWLSQDVYKITGVLVTMIITKILSRCSRPKDITKYILAKCPQGSSAYADASGLINDWFIKSIADCQTTEELDDFQSGMDVEQRKMYDNEVNRRSIQLQVA